MPAFVWAEMKKGMQDERRWDKDADRKERDRSGHLEKEEEKGDLF